MRQHRDHSETVKRGLSAQDAHSLNLVLHGSIECPGAGLYVASLAGATASAGSAGCNDPDQRFIRPGVDRDTSINGKVIALGMGDVGLNRHCGTRRLGKKDPRAPCQDLFRP